MTSATNLIASANTTGGYAIGVISQPSRFGGETIFSVVRMDRNSRYVTISNHTDEATARKHANIEYKADMGI